MNNSNATEILAWVGRDCYGDNIALKCRRKLCMVDANGKVILKRYLRSQAVQPEHGYIKLEVKQTSELVPGNTYVISNSDIGMCKMIGSNLFGYTIFYINIEDTIVVTEVTYSDMVQYLNNGDIKLVKAL